MTETEFLISQLMARGYSRQEAEAIATRSAIASELVQQGVPLERALTIANSVVGSIESSGQNPSPSFIETAPLDAPPQAPVDPNTGQPVTATAPAPASAPARGGIAPAVTPSATPTVAAPPAQAPTAPPPAQVPNVVFGPPPSDLVNTPTPLRP